MLFTVVVILMKGFVFGNSPSPALAIYGLHRTARHGASEFGVDAKHFVERDFYVDDGLKSLPSAAEAIDLLKRAQEMLAASNLRLHKIASNHSDVFEAFPPEDHAKGLQNLDFDDNSALIQRSLGLSWDLKHDIFTFRVAATEKPFTRRGVLATVNSLFDPLGLVAPITIQGKFLLRELISCEALDWDSPLPDRFWRMWKDSLQDLSEFKIPRAYIPTTLSTAQRKELHIFSDASVKAIAAVAYLKVIDSDGECHVGFVLGKAKLAPAVAHTIPRLELGAAVLAVEVAELVETSIDIFLTEVKMAEDIKTKLENYRTAPFDARFPNSNQTRNCWANYLDFHRCQKVLDAKGVDNAPCDWYKRVYKSLCPMSWVQKWDDQREEGTFPGKI